MSTYLTTEAGAQLVSMTTAESAAYLPSTPAEPEVLPGWLEQDVPPDLLTAVMAHPAEEIAAALAATGTADPARLFAHFAQSAEVHS